MALTDAFLDPFLQDSFDAADYFNATLPALSVTTKGHKSPQPSGAVTLPALSSQTQTLLSQLNAQTTRLSNSLTQLTDDILRTGGRLAYQVEVLRGEASGLHETLHERLQDDITKFAPNGLSLPPQESSSDETKEGQVLESAAQEPSEALPPYITQLRTLTLVRARLESVIKVFGEAMQWTLPPSEVSLASSLISVSAPEPGSENYSREEKGREFSEKLRNEVGEMIAGGGAGDESGYDAALARIQALRDLAQLWKGTAEEKARLKFVEGLVKLAEDRQRTLENSS